MHVGIWQKVNMRVTNVIKMQMCQDLRPSATACATRALIDVCTQNVLVSTANPVKLKAEPPLSNSP